MPIARECAEAIEAMAAAPFLTGDTYSLADIRLVPHFAWFPMTSEGAAILTGKDKLNQWFATVSERPNVKQVLQPL